MPLTLSNYPDVRDTDIKFSRAALAARPELAAMAMHVIGIWSKADADLLYVLSTCLKADQEMATGLLGAVRSQEGQRLMITRAVETVMPDEVRDLCVAAILATDELRKTRHAFAYHLWGTCSSIDHELLLIDPKYLTRRGVSLTSRPEGWDRTKP